MFFIQEININNMDLMVGYTIRDTKENQQELKLNGTL
jgi:hypothetical protein